jgi:hypothetical protein
MFTNLLIVLGVILFFNTDLKLLQNLQFINTIFWGMITGHKTATLCKEYLNGQNSSGKDDKRDNQ